MDLIISISVACIAAAFVFLVIYLIKTLQAAKESLDQVRVTLAHLEGKVDEIAVETVQVMQHTKHVIADVEGKMQSLDSLFQSIGQVGESVHQLTTSVKQASATVSHSVQRVGAQVGKEVGSKDQATVAQWLEVASVCVHLWKKWQTRRKLKQAANDYRTRKDELNV